MMDKIENIMDNIGMDGKQAGRSEKHLFSQKFSSIDRTGDYAPRDLQGHLKGKNIWRR